MPCTGTHSPRVIESNATVARSSLEKRRGKITEDSAVSETLGRQKSSALKGMPGKLRDFRPSTPSQAALFPEASMPDTQTLSQQLPYWQDHGVRCVRCTQTFKSVQSLEEHLTDKNCGYTLSTQGTLSIQVQCHSCKDKIFNCLAGIVQHITAVHTYCGRCGKEFVHSHSVRRGNVWSAPHQLWTHERRTGHGVRSIVPKRMVTCSNIVDRSPDVTSREAEPSLLDSSQDVEVPAASPLEVDSDDTSSQDTSSDHCTPHAADPAYDATAPTSPDDSDDSSIPTMSDVVCSKSRCVFFDWNMESDYGGLSAESYWRAEYSYLASTDPSMGGDDGHQDGESSSPLVPSPGDDAFAAENSFLSTLDYTYPEGSIGQLQQTMNSNVIHGSSTAAKQDSELDIEYIPAACPQCHEAFTDSSEMPQLEYAQDMSDIPYAKHINPSSVNNYDAHRSKHGKAWYECADCCGKFRSAESQCEHRSTTSSEREDKKAVVALSMSDLSRKFDLMTFTDDEGTSNSGGEGDLIEL